MRFSITERLSENRKSNIAAKNSNEFGDEIFILYRKRFLVNFLLCLSLLLNGQYWISFSAITTELSIYFNKTTSQINWFSNVFLLFPGLVAMFSVFLPDTIGLKWCLIFGCLLHSLGSFLRFIPVFALAANKDAQYVICLTGSVILAFAQGVILNLPSYLSAKWFGANERDVSTAVACLSNLIGYSLGFLFSFSVMRNYSNPDQYGKGLKIIVCVEFSASLVCRIYNIKDSTVGNLLISSR
ncbi:hypothetical protein MXB_1272 [Myxobolus squamalis]|nr:hypothetical protein MXB_1272 [Myxobolus squamalis]